MLSVSTDAKTMTANSMPGLRIVTNTRGANVQEETPATAAACIDALTRPLTAEEQHSGEFVLPAEPRVLYSGTYEGALAAMEGDLARCTVTTAPAVYTDGSPVALPTEEAVAKMLTGTSHPPEEVIGPIGPAMKLATVEKIAVNAVMAGCKPEYMPVLLALTEAMVNTDVATALLGAQGWFTLGAVINGPIAKEIRLNTGGPVLSGPAPLTPGVPANTTIGRFLRLVMINIGGVEPGLMEAKGIGHPAKTSIVIAEATDESPWPQMSTTAAGFLDRTNTATLMVMWGDMLNGFRAKYTGPGSEATITKILGPAAEAAKFLSRSQQGLLVMISPADAQALAAAGYSKEDCQAWISEHCVDPFWKAKQMGLGSGVVGTHIKIQGVPLSQTGQWPPEWKDPNFDQNTIVQYYPVDWGITIIVSIGSYNGLIMNGTPRWTVAIDQWK